MLTFNKACAAGGHNHVLSFNTACAAGGHNHVLSFNTACAVGHTAMCSHLIWLLCKVHMPDI